MDDMFGGASDSLRLPKPLIAAAIAVAAIAAVVAYTGNGLDVLALALVVLFIVIIERTVGDWFAELMGPALSSAVLAGAAGVCVWQLLVGSGRETTYTFFAAAEHRGYRTLFLHQALEYGSRSNHWRESTSTTGAVPSADAPPVSSPRSTSVPSPPASSPVARSRIALAEESKNSIARNLSNMLVLSVPSEVKEGNAVSVSVTLREARSSLRRGRVEILLDERVVGTADIRPDGTAVATVIAPRPGTHTLRARLPGVVGGTSTATLIVRR